MNYEKLTPERFAENLKNGKYEGPTGARRAIGKTEWSDKDKDACRAVVDKHFGVAAGVPKKARKAGAATKHAAPPALRKPKRVAAKPAPKQPAKKARTARAQFNTEASAFSVTPARSAPLESATRFNAASTVIAAFKQGGVHGDLEQTTYDNALKEFNRNLLPSDDDASSAHGKREQLVPARVVGKEPTNGTAPKPLIVLDPEEQAALDALDALA